MMIHDPENRKVAMEKLLRQLWAGSFTECPRRSEQYQNEENNVVPINRYNLGFSYLGFFHPENPEHMASSPVRTFQTLFSILGDDRTVQYLKPNTFWASFNMSEEYLRFLNAFVIDIDDPTIDEGTILWRCYENGLPAPTAINRTPSGGAHVWFLLTDKVAIPKTRAMAANGSEYSKIVKLYNLIHKRMTEVFEGDQEAVGASRFIRIPRALTYYNPEQTQSFQQHISWLHEWFPENDPKSPLYFLKKGTSAGRHSGGQRLLDSQAAKILMSGVSKGSRNAACYALACLHRHDGCSVENAMDILINQWNPRNNPQIEVSEIRRTVISAYNKNFLPLQKIKDLTDHCICVSRWTKFKKPRSERERMHLNEWIEDIYFGLKKCGGKKFGSQAELAAAFDMPLSTFKKLLKKLKSSTSSPFQIRVLGNGRNGGTEIFLRHIVHKPIPNKKAILDDFLHAYGTVYPEAVGFGALNTGNSDEISRAGP